MKDKPNDRVSDVMKSAKAEGKKFKPEIRLVSGQVKLANPTLEAKFENVKKEREHEIEVRNGWKIVPALATYFVGEEYSEQKKGSDPACKSHIAGVYCTCNKVNACRCVEHSGGSGGGSICTCVPVH